MTKIPKYLLNLAGEYRIASELTKRGIFATVTYGNHKGVDVYAISDRQQRALKIEVKTSQKANFVTGIGQKNCWENDPSAPDFWVLFQIQPQEDGRFKERFFVLTHNEICAIQRARNKPFAEKYKAQHGEEWDPTSGVDNVTVKDVEAHEDQWGKIMERIGRALAAAV